MSFVWAERRTGILQLLQAIYSPRPAPWFIAAAPAAGQRGSDRQSGILASGQRGAEGQTLPWSVGF